MKWIYDYIEKNPESVVVGPVPMAQILEKLKADLHGADVPLASFTPNTIQMQQRNAYYYACDRQMGLRQEDMQLKAVRIPVTDQTRHYAEKDFTHWFVNGSEDGNGIYVIYEERSNYFYCNSSMLHLEMTIARGISEADIANHTERYAEYASLMQRYLEDYCGYRP